MSENGTAITGWRQVAHAIMEGCHSDKLQLELAITKALEAAAVAPPEAAWLPIDSAPKDGTPFLCFHPDDVFSPVPGIDLIWWEPSKQFWTMDGDSTVPFVAKPTHWRPLPAPPSTATRE